MPYQKGVHVWDNYYKDWQGRIFIFLKGGVEKLLVGCKRQHWALGLNIFIQNDKIEGVKRNFGGVETL